jgi:hypothetical protein
MEQIKFSGKEIIDAVTQVMLEMNTKFQKKEFLTSKDMVTIGYVSLAIQRLESDILETLNQGQ